MNSTAFPSPSPASQETFPVLEDRCNRIFLWKRCHLILEVGGGFFFQNLDSALVAVWISRCN